MVLDVLQSFLFSVQAEVFHGKLLISVYTVPPAYPVSHLLLLQAIVWLACLYYMPIIIIS